MLRSHNVVNHSWIGDTIFVWCGRARAYQALCLTHILNYLRSHEELANLLFETIGFADHRFLSNDRLVRRDALVGRTAVLNPSDFR
jgi:hypothetical protein